MKTKNLILAILFGLSYSSQAQVQKHSLGFRFGPSLSNSIGHLNYQLGLNNRSRLDFGMALNGGFGGNTTVLGGMFSVHYHRVKNLKGGLNLFYGAGGGMRMNRIAGSTIPNTFNQQFSIGAVAGLEYDFSQHNVPLIVSLDYSPNLLLNPNASGYFNTSNFGLSIKYVIK